jgi:hypothetical protein
MVVSDPADMIVSDLAEYDVNNYNQPITGRFETGDAHSDKRTANGL